MRSLVVGVAGVVACVLAFGALGVGAQDDVTARDVAFNRPYYDFAPQRPSWPAVISGADAAIPRVYIRFDDGRAGADPDNPVKSQVAAYLRRGLPVALTLHSDKIGTTSRYMTWEDVRELQDFARAKGTVLHILSHSNDSMTGIDSTSTHDEWLAELDPSDIIRQTGYRPRVFIGPGDGTEYLVDHSEYLESVLDSLGFWYSSYGNGTTRQRTMRMFPPLMGAPDAVGDASYRLREVGSKPGMGYYRHGWEGGGFGDLGGSYVERVASAAVDYYSVQYADEDSVYLYGGEHITGVIPPSVDAWTIAGTGADAAGDGYVRSAWYSISLALSQNLGFVVAQHDSGAASNEWATTSLPSGMSAAEQLESWSPDKMAWLIAMLEAKGHIIVVGPEEFYRWATGEFAPDTELIANRRMANPQFDIGDTLGWTTEYPWVRGLGNNYSQNASQSVAMGPATNMSVDQTGLTAKYDKSSAASPYNNFGNSVIGTMGRPGGIELGGDGIQPYRLQLTFGGLKPGRYDFSVDYNAGTGNQLSIEEYHQLVMVRGYRWDAALEGGFVPVFRDTVFAHVSRDTLMNVSVPSIDRNEWKTLHFYPWLPSVPTGEVFTDAAFGTDGRMSLTSPFQPYTDNNTADYFGYLTGAQWAIQFQITTLGLDARFSNARLVYLGD